MNAVVSPQSVHTLPCPACGRSSDHRFMYSKNGCDILQCRECHLGRTEAADFDPSAYYTDSYFSGGHADGYANYQGAEPILRREFAREVKFIRSYCSSGKLIEIGCAYGFFLQEAKRYFDVAGIEFADDAAAHGRRNSLDVRTGVADESTLAEFGNADVFVLLDVIEHLPEPYETLSLCARHLKPGGIIVLTTGDFASPVARWSGPAWRLMTPPQHLWFFTPGSFRALASRLGLALESLDHPWKIVPLSLINFQLRRIFGLPGAQHRKTERLGLPVNLFDAMRVVLRKPS
jgi:SAM-dependent methyltransferase